MGHGWVSYRVRQKNARQVQEPPAGRLTPAGPPTSSSPWPTTSRPPSAVAALAPSRRRPTSRKLVRDRSPLLVHPIPTLLDSAGLRVQDVVADFDDPNIDKDAVLLGTCVSYWQSRPRPLNRPPLAPSEDDSPYPEVRSAVANTDDPSMPVSSLRTWVLGLIWAIIIPGMNQFFFFRFPSVTVGGVRRPDQDAMCCVLTVSLDLDCGTADLVPHRPGMGKVHAECEGLRRCAQPRSVQRQGACVDHHHG